jgi:Fe-S cluster assembly scaffold protein SufB
MPHTTKDDVWRRTVDMRTQDYWRRTRRYLRGFAVEKYHPSVPNGAVSAKDVDYSEAGTAGVLVQVDGQRQYASDSEMLKEKGVYFADLHTALQEQPELLRTYFMNKAVTLETALKSGNIAQHNKLMHFTAHFGKVVTYCMFRKA